VSFRSSHLAIKNCYNVHFMKILKIDPKIDCFAKNSKKFVYYNEELVQNFKLNYLENYNNSEHALKTKNAPFFMIFPNISLFHMIVTYWTGPLKDNILYKKKLHDNCFLVHPKVATTKQYRIDWE
jgi:hypothetical protein